MNRFVRSLTVSILLLFFATPLIARDYNKQEREISENTVLSLLEGLSSDNLGLRTGCAYMLGELRVSDAVIPLMRMLREDKKEAGRISAALALYKIGTPLSINAVKQAVRFDDSNRLSRLAANFYNDYLLNKTDNEDKFTDTTYATLK